MLLPNIWHCPTGAPSFYCASGTECYCPIFDTAQPGLQVFILLPAQNSNVHPCTVPMSWYCTNIVVLSIPMCNVVHCTNVVVLYQYRGTFNSNVQCRALYQCRGSSFHYATVCRLCFFFSSCILYWCLPVFLGQFLLCRRGHSSPAGPIYLSPAFLGDGC